MATLYVSRIVAVVPGGFKESNVERIDTLLHCRHPAEMPYADCLVI